MNLNITAEQVREVFDYDPERGVLVWKKKTGNRVRVGAVAGKPHPTIGYVVVRCSGAVHYAHRLAFLHVTGRMPEQVDHINGVRSDNRWSNLRESDNARNRQNGPLLQANSTSGVNGVYWHKQQQKWHVSLKLDRKKRSFGLYGSLLDAAAVAKRERAKLHPLWAREQS